MEYLPENDNERMVVMAVLRKMRKQPVELQIIDSNQFMLSQSDMLSVNGVYRIPQNEEVNPEVMKLVAKTTHFGVATMYVNLLGKETTL